MQTSPTHRVAFTPISAVDADDVWQQAWAQVTTDGRPRASQQKGPSRELLHVALALAEPRQRWVYSRAPAINPAFALAEVIWILAGRSDTEFLLPWNKSLPRFIGATKVAYGAYGERLRYRFGVDQLQLAASALAASPHSRQIVLQIWDPTTDLPSIDGTPPSEDIPCNVTALLKVADGKLHWFQVMRSNDLVRGLPYNLIQWTTIQEILAGWLDLEIGEYTHWCDSLHIYDSDRPSYTCHPIASHQNTDSLMVSSGHFSEIIESLVSAVIKLGAASDATEINDCLVCTSLPEAYLNWLRVMASERARRLRLLETPSLLRSITNPSLRAATAAWFNRWEKGLG